MADYRSMFDRDYIFAFDLDGRDVTVTISKVVAGELTGEGGRKSKKPIMFFEGKDKGLAINKTNGKTIASMYGNDTTKWIGERITLYPTTTQMGGETKDCIRVRPRIPQPNGERRPQQNRPRQAAPVQPAAEPTPVPTDEEIAAAIDRGEA